MQQQHTTAAARSSDATQQQSTSSSQSSWRRAELDARAHVMRAAPASAGASAAATSSTSANANALASSPVAVSSCRSASSSTSRFSSHERPRSTRALLSRIFRSPSTSSKSKSSPKRSSDGGDNDRLHRTSAVHSPILASAMDALQLRHRESLPAAEDTSRLDSHYYYAQQQSESDDMRGRRESAPAQMKSYGLQYHYPQQQSSCTSPTADDRVAARKVLVQGYLTKLPVYKYWHAKPSYFVLEESCGGGSAPAALRVTLRQFRKHEDALAGRSDLVLSELALSEDDVVVDISQQYAKHGFELMLAAASDASSENTSVWSAMSALASSSAHSAQSQQQQQHHHRNASTGSTTLAVRSLRLAAPDALALEHWISVVGTAIAKLIFQAAAQSASHRSEHGAVPSKFAVSAKVAPIVPDAGDNNSDNGGGGSSDSLEQCEEIRQAEQQPQIMNNDDDAVADDDDEEKPRGPIGATRTSPTAAQPEHDYVDCENVELEHHHKPLRRCPSCEQWMPFDCDADEQTSCCSRGSEHGSGYSDNNNNSSNNNVHDNDGDNQDDADWSDAGTDDFSHMQPRSSDSFVSPRSPPSSASSVTSFTPSDSPNSSVMPEPAAMTFSIDEPNGSRASAFSNFIVSPNPPVQFIQSSPSLGTQQLYANKREASDTAGANGELKAPAPAFLRSNFARSGTNPSTMAAQCYYRAPPVHSFTANGQVFTLDTRYKLIKSIGTGAYGAVIAVQDSVAGIGVAVKKITNIFEDLVDAKRILREVRLLHHFTHKNITQLLDLAPPASRRTFDDMYIITELMETDLHQVIYSMQPMSDDHVKYFLYQMLCALHHIHSAGVIHRDMKPSNVLLNSNCDLKICDFGLARGGVAATAARATGRAPTSTPPTEQVTRMREELTEYVVTRWYRAPEIMLNCLQYTEAIDVWAVGCIFAEMLLREPLFPGNDYIHQLKLIIKFLGTPKQEDIEFVKNAKALRFLTKLPISKPRKWKDVFASGSGDDGSDVNPLAIDLLSQMLLFNPAKRISVERALQHPYLATFYDPADITPARAFDFAFDLPDDKLSKEALVDLLCEDIEQFHPMSTMAVAPSNSSSAAVAGHANRFFVMGTTASAS